MQFVSEVIDQKIVRKLFLHLLNPKVRRSKLTNWQLIGPAKYWVSLSRISSLREQLQRCQGMF